MTRNLRPLDPPTTIPIHKSDGGYVAQGPGFYIWDEDPSEVLRVARALARGKYDVNPTSRLLVMRDDLHRRAANRRPGLDGI